jgi:probable phosphomutase (TIGR03848 family)
VARLIFLRHAHSIANEKGILSGQLPNIPLSKLGKIQADQLVERIGKSSFDSVRVSPMQRCEETINPWLSSRYSQGISQYLIDSSLIEVDYGKWSGRKLSTLSRDPLWKDIQNSPSIVRFPQGESIKGAQKRALTSIHQALKEKSQGTHLFVSHGDIIKSIVASLMKIHLNHFQSLVVDPASITVIDFDGSKSRLISFNDSHTPIHQLTNKDANFKALLGGGARRLTKGKR